MLSSKTILTVAVLVAAAAAAFVFLGGPDPVSPVTEQAAVEEPAVTSETGSGPSLEISVSGQANGEIVIELFPEVAPLHVARISELAKSGAYDGIVFHRVIDGFMAQTGDVEFGQTGGDTAQAGRGGSDLPDLPAEFSDRSFARGVVGMARSNSPNSANSQFFIMFAPAPHLDGQYTVVGQVTSGLDVLDAIKMGTGANGSVVGEPDVMQTVTVKE